MRTEFEADTVCPYCAKVHDRATAVQGEFVSPCDGDVTICIQCGELCVFDSHVAGGLRSPTEKEQGELYADDDLLKLRKAWKMMKEGE